MQHHKYNLEELENMMPFERDIYTLLVANYVSEENERIQQQAQQKAKGR